MSGKPTEEEIRAALADIRQREMKEALREALKEWLSEQLATFGWWTTKGLGAAALAGLVYLILWKTGHSMGWGK